MSPHDMPSPANPLLHVQLKLPSVSVQIAQSWRNTHRSFTRQSIKAPPQHLAIQQKTAHDNSQAHVASVAAERALVDIVASCNAVPGEPSVAVAAEAAIGVDATCQGLSTNTRTHEPLAPPQTRDACRWLTGLGL
eukprot:717494-Rhodomonas_salina.2